MTAILYQDLLFDHDDAGNIAEDKIDDYVAKLNDVVNFNEFSSAPLNEVTPQMSFSDLWS